MTLVFLAVRKSRDRAENASFISKPRRQAFQRISQTKEQNPHTGRYRHVLLEPSTHGTLVKRERERRFKKKCEKERSYMKEMLCWMARGTQAHSGRQERTLEMPLSGVASSSGLPWVASSCDAEDSLCFSSPPFLVQAGGCRRHSPFYSTCAS